MELKKHKHADLERFKSVFLLVGYVASLSIILLAFEWSTSEVSTDGLGQVQDVVMEDEQIPITRQEAPPPPPPPPPKVVAEVLNIVDDDVEIEEEMEIEDMEVDEETEVEIVEIEEEEEEAPIFFIVEEMPEFPGGEKAIGKFLQQNIKYPEIARENDIHGKVYVRFAVTADGKVDKVSVARGVDPLLDAEAIRVVNKMPRWKPGMQRGKAVSVWYTLPINFQLQ